MGRPELHSRDVILDATRALVLEGGARSTTMAAVADACGAPKGSIYHRFSSLDDLLAEMWLRAVRRAQAAFLESLDHPDPLAAAIAGALAIYDFSEREPDDARLLASLRREDLIERVVPSRRRELEELNQPLTSAITKLVRRLFGRATARNVERTTFAVIDVPMGGIRRHLIAGATLPPSLRAQLEAAVRAALLEGRGAESD